MRLVRSLDRRPRIGCLGLGWIGCHRLQALRDSGLVRAVALADPSQEARARAAGIVEAPEFVGATLDDLLQADLGLDGLVIATPSAQHAAQAQAALAQGLAVFAQKPLARTRAETIAVIDGARSADRLLGVDFSYRFTRAMTAIRDEVQSGSLGDIYAAHLTFHNAYGPDKPWFYDRTQSGGGCLMDLGSHLIDLVFWLGAAPVVETTSRLFANGVRLGAGDTDAEDYACVQLDHADGATSSITCSWRLSVGSNAAITFEWFGTLGGVRLANVNGSFYDFVAERLTGTDAVALASPPDAWGGGAILDWAARLAAGGAYEPAVEDVLEVASVLDQSYGVTSRNDGRARSARPQPRRAAGEGGATR